MSKSDGIYLDYAAATPVSEEVIHAMHPIISEDFYNPSAQYSAARKLKKRIKVEREKVAFWLGAKPNEIVFTAGVSESVNLAIKGIMHRFPEGKVLYGATEHEVVIETAKQFKSDPIAVDSDGIIDLERLKNQISDDVVLISVMYANNETGVITSLNEISKLISETLSKRAANGNDLPLYFHSDAAQAANYLDLHVSRLGVDLMSLSGAKIYGPKQSGALFIKAGVEINPLIHGGGQERSLRGGTENIAGIVGFSTALDQAQSIRRDESARIAELRNYLEQELLAIAETQINGSLKNRLPNIANITVLGLNGERAVLELDEAGLMVATGAACSADDDGPSHVLIAMGLEQSVASSSLRISLGKYTTKSEIDESIKLIKNVAEKNRSR